MSTTLAHLNSATAAAQVLLAKPVIATVKAGVASGTAAGRTTVLAGPEQ